MKELIKKADVLIEALPYIRQFSDKIVVIKYGGSAMENDVLKQNVIQDIVLMKFIGIKPVIVHGGGKKISEIMSRMGKEPEFVQGLRVTDDETVEIAEMVLAGSINKGIVQLINQLGGQAVGLCGKDGNMIQAKKHELTDELGNPIAIDLGYVGEIIRVKPEVITTLLDANYIPVVAPNGVGENGATYNINADTMAGEMAAALKAEKLILLTDQLGIMRDLEDQTTLIPSIMIDEIDKLVADDVIKSGMLPKVGACVTALKAGVTKTHIIDGRLQHTILLEIFTSTGIGTEIILR